MRDLRVASVQMENVDGDKRANLDKIKTFASEAAAQGVEMIVFPEVCITGCWFLTKLSRQQLEALAEPVPEGPSTQALLAMAKQHRMTIGAGLVEISPEGEMFNTYVVAMPNGEVQRHRKLHCFMSEHMSSGSECWSATTTTWARTSASRP